MKQVFLLGAGRVETLEVPLPGRMAGSALVRNRFSLISSGTESAAVSKSGGVLGILEKAHQSRGRAAQVWEMAKRVGVAQTIRLVRHRLEEYTALGYSSAGDVIEVDGDDVGCVPGDRVACIGLGFAFHGEYVAVPKNLMAKVPEGVATDEAAFGALACIAMQGIRRLGLTPGERVGVLGLGLIGQVCIRLLAAMGYRPAGIDLLEARAAKAREVPGVEAWSTRVVDSIQRVSDLTAGRGLDGVVVCAATRSDDVVNLAFDLCRPQGCVSVVGDVGLGLQREKMYAKELDLRISRSYGPGRYDPDFELRGRDYPLGYVRWTETRNLEFFLSLLAMGRLSLRSLLTERYPVDQSAAAYAGLKENRPDCYGVLFDYAVPERAPEGGVRLARILETSPPSVRIGADRIRLGLIGVGGHARAVHVPALRQLADRFEICGVASRSTAGAATGAKLTGARMVATDYRELLHHPEVDAVLIATRHASHARIVLEALEAGKHVFVEKPMAVSVADAQAIQDRAVEMGRIVRVGFNRRFAPYLNLLRSAVGTSGRRVLSCRVNVGAIRNDWSNTPEEGGRLLGEGVHFMDLFNWFMGAEPVRLVGMVAGPHDRTNPNVTVSVQYPDGDVAQLVYTSLGTSGFGKEFYEAFGGGRAGRMEDFRTLEIVGASVPARRADRNDKGQRAELEEFAAAVRGETYPIAGADARAGLLATWMVLAAYQSAAEGRAIERAV